MKGKHSTVAIIAGCCLLVVTGVGVGLWYSQPSQPSEPPPVFEMDSGDYTDNGSLKESSVPSGQQILAALRSDDREAIESAYYILWEIVTGEDTERLWPDELSKKRVYDQIRRHLESEDAEVSAAALSGVNPRYEFGKNFYQSEEDIKRVRQAIKRFNERECDKRSESWSCLELVLNEEGEPVKIEYSAGATDH